MASGVFYVQLFQSPTFAAMPLSNRLTFGCERPGSAGSQIGIGGFVIKDNPFLAMPLIWDTPSTGLNGTRIANVWRRQIPHNFATSAALVIPSLPWLHSRFALRTLLIDTTIVALVLRLVGWAA